MPFSMCRAILILYIICFLCHHQAIYVVASVGDRLDFFNLCISYCKFVDCSNKTYSSCSHSQERCDSSQLTFHPEYDESAAQFHFEKSIHYADECLRWSKWLKVQNLPSIVCNYNGDRVTVTNDRTNDRNIPPGETVYYSVVNSATVTDHSSYQTFQDKQPFYLTLLGWSCSEECRYQCQWRTINYLMSPSVGVTWNNIPQFHGKWTFKRFLGIQEPASALFSLINLLSTLIGWLMYHRKITQLRSTVKLPHIFSKTNNKRVILDGSLTKSPTVSQESVKCNSPSFTLSTGSLNRTSNCNAIDRRQETVQDISSCFLSVTPCYLKIFRLIFDRLNYIYQLTLIDEYYLINMISFLLGVNAW